MKKAYWQKYEEWRKHGLNNNYDEINPAIIKKNKNKLKRSWYERGQKKHWLDKFKFKKLKEKSFVYFKYFEEWKDYGLKNGFDERNPKSLEESKNKKERSWYENGLKQKWSENFEFKRKRMKKGIWRNLEFALEKGAEFLEKHIEYNELPSGRILVKIGYGSFIRAIEKYHSGILTFRKKLRKYLGQPSENKILENLLEEYVGG